MGIKIELISDEFYAFVITSINSSFKLFQNLGGYKILGALSSFFLLPTNSPHRMLKRNMAQNIGIYMHPG